MTNSKDNEAWQPFSANVMGEYTTAKGLYIRDGDTVIIQPLNPLPNIHITEELPFRVGLQGEKDD